ncbi:hypothetical protein RQM47_05485 [Rubrivirga sp. S365]|uniref:Protease inhibitor Inh n=1 Tax=Rubrivirga litoralis TaxID=3075598 RepID=A0ABU3BR38_9BACT|nr:MULTISPECIES: hypothetical protein [unclassified Rubrivirga]MDT0631750.1 hypothetical protein [Rubrivirga sp. F394]MDT7856085.1 hypothetical protein [Rubrivirga sp. S365]
MLRPVLLVLLLTAAGGAAAQADVPPADLPPLPAALQGAWEMVEAPAYDAGPTIHRLWIRVEGNRVTQRDSLSLGNRHAARDFTATCAEADGLVSCWPSDRGTQTGYGGLGRYRVDGDALVFEDPDRGDRIVLRRAGA